MSDLGPFGASLLAITLVVALDGMYQKDLGTEILTSVSPVENTNLLVVQHFSEFTVAASLII